MSNRSRKHRGYKTQRLVAEYIQHIYPYCHSPGAGEPGKDVLNTPGISIEIKARSKLDIKGSLRQAAANAEPGDLPILVARMNGQGENAGEYAAILSLESLTKLLEQGRENRNANGRRQDHRESAPTGAEDTQPIDRPDGAGPPDSSE